MLTLRPSQERGLGDHGWLHTRHSFSFAGYFDRHHMGFRSLRVINEDRIERARGFGLHPHENMEILSYVVEGSLAHQDTAGHTATLGRGGVQFMSAGSGISHSEFNGSKEDPVRLLQIWIKPAEQSTPPRYEDNDFNEALEAGGLVALASPDGRDASIRIGQDVFVLAARLKAGESATRELAPGRGAWIQVVDGELAVNGQPLTGGDGLAIEDEAAVRLSTESGAELLLFDLA